MGSDKAGWGALAEPIHTDKVLPPNAPPWRENAFFAYFDRDRKVYGTSHFTGSLNAGGRRARTSLVVDGRAVEIVEPMPLGEFGTPGVQVDLGGHIIAKSDELHADLNFVAGRDQIDYSASKALPGLDDAEPLRHYQGSGTWSGTISVGGNSIDVSGGCLRDRTWGYREEIQHWLEYYACFILFDDFDLTMMKFHVKDGTAPAHGAMVGSRSGRITDGTVRRNGWGSITRLDAALGDGGTVEMSVAPCEARIWCPLGEPDGPTAITVYDEFVEVTTQDGVKGFGVVEQGILRQLA